MNENYWCWVRLSTLSTASESNNPWVCRSKELINDLVQTNFARTVVFIPVMCSFVLFSLYLLLFQCPSFKLNLAVPMFKCWGQYSRLSSTFSRNTDLFFLRGETVICMADDTPIKK